MQSAVSSAAPSLALLVGARGGLQSGTLMIPNSCGDGGIACGCWEAAWKCKYGLHASSGAGRAGDALIW